MTKPMTSSITMAGLPPTAASACVPIKPPYDQRINRIIQLLKQGAAGQGQKIQQESLSDHAFCQIRNLRHMLFFPVR